MRVQVTRKVIWLPKVGLVGVEHDTILLELRNYVFDEGGCDYPPRTNRFHKMPIVARQVFRLSYPPCEFKAFSRCYATEADEDDLSAECEFVLEKLNSSIPSAVIKQGGIDNSPRLN